NRRFVAGESSIAAHISPERRNELVSAQEPFAIILGCSDSRVPAELVFNQGLGDLFVVRVAGNIAAPSQIGSIEFAAASFGTRLVVVLGHSRCGAVRATLREIRRPAAPAAGNLSPIIDRIRPAVEGLVAEGLDGEELVRRAVRANVRTATERLRGSELLSELGRQDGLLVAGAEYSLTTGLVDFFDLPRS
ncbi:MAG: carbonic anhydrase, partial [Thermoanaerobaculia bacterium]|nr:carbonic anhydrase [Thermoanaerobaculia bacterium]